MARIEVKICGLKTADAVGAALKGGARYVGFNFIEKSPRYVGPAEAAVLREQVPPGIWAVALTADFGDETLAHIVRAVRPDALQLHGSETPARAAAVREAFGLPVIKACAIGAPGDVEAALAFEAAADHILFDAKPPKGADMAGGHGGAFDWKLLGARRPKKPWFLAGGLTQGNVREAVAATGAPIVDVSSGVEVRRGDKDAGLIKAFLDTARAL